MIYNKPTQEIPQDSRKDINSKILHLIETGNLQGLTSSDIYAAFTGKGGLHGLSFNNFNSFHDYTEAKKDIEFGEFFTPHDTAKTISELLHVQPSDLVADLTCGNGSFFNFMPTQSNIYGCELNNNNVRVAKFLYPNANIVCSDIRDYKPNVKFDSVLLNPPFNLNFDGISSQMYTCVKAFENMKPLALMALIVPKSFLNDEMVNKKDIEEMNSMFNFIGQYELSKTEFKQMGVSNFETKVMFFQKKSEFVDNIDFVNIFSDIDYIDNLLSNARALKSTLRAKTMSEVSTDNHDFIYKVKKYLYEFKTHKNLQYYSSKADALLEKFNTQKKPEKMEWKEWDKIKLTENKVLSVFKRVMKNAYIVEKDVVRLVKRRGDFKIKSYSTKMRNQINKRTKTTICDIDRMISLNNVYDDFLLTCKSLGLNTNELQKVVSKKQKNYLIHNASIKNLNASNSVKTFTNKFRFKDDRGTHKLHDIQKLDISKVLTRDYTLLSWEQGLGKTIALMSVTKFWLKNNLVKNVFITAPAIAMDLTLKEALKLNNIKFIEIKDSKELKNIKDGQVVMMTLGRLSGSKKEVKQFIKSKSNKVGLIFDESDEITNYVSKRTRAVLDAFRRCRKKLLMTGTVTRNNVSEIYSNLELMYNNSYNFMCHVDSIYRQDKKTKDIKKFNNKNNQKSFGALYGFGLFKSCFAPSKASVFGIQKDLQDIYNVGDLKRIIERTVITRTLEEVAGKKKQNHTIYVKPNSDEKLLQNEILENFHQICYTYFKSTGNERKESYLRIIRMINLLIKSTSTPHLMDEWIGQGLPTKYKKVVEMVNERPNEQILIGCVGIPATKSYYEEIKRNFPNRNVIYIDGTVSFKRRKKLVSEFNESNNDIIVANQASLKSSVNIPECNTVIVTGLPWNGSKLNQFTSRTIRFNSKNITDVYLLCYSESIELNILNLILNKEKVNNFIKTTEITTDEEVNEDYGVDANMLGSLLSKHYDEDGGMQLSWGNESQRVA